jgi:hypothetical protein
MSDAKLTLGNVNFGPARATAKVSSTFIRDLSMDEIVRDAVAKEMAIKESFIARYITETGAKVADTMLMEQTHSDGITKSFWCEPIVKPKKPTQRQQTVLDAIRDLVLDITKKQAEILHLVHSLEQK